MAEGSPKFYIQWSVVNWITIVLMAFSMLFVASLLISAIRHYKGVADVQNAGATD